MADQIHIPKGKLSSCIKFMWHSKGEPISSDKERVLPSGTSQLIINLGHDCFRHYEKSNVHVDDHTIISGIQSRYLFLDSRTRRYTMGVVFKEDGLSSLLGIPADEFLNQTVALDDVLSLDVSGLRQRLQTGTNPQDRFNILEAALTNLMGQDFNPNPAIVSAIHRMKNSSGFKSVSEMAERVGYSRRRFSDLFRQIAGISPKEYMRIQRFQNSLEIIRQHPDPDWSEVALSCGYYDQAHFNRDFKAFSGLTPSQYFENQTSEVNHLAM